jgi:hypothetical protein
MGSTAVSKAPAPTPSNGCCRNTSNPAFQNAPRLLKSPLSISLDMVASRVQEELGAK